MMGLSLIIFTIGFAIMIVLCVMNTDEMSNGFTVFTFSIIAITLIAWGFHTELNYREGYKEGQVDALKGKVEYELKVKQDTVWIDKSNH